MSGAALVPCLKNNYGKDRTAYHLTADYTWGWTQEEGSMIKLLPERLSAGNTNCNRSHTCLVPVTSRPVHHAGSELWC